MGTSPFTAHVHTVPVFCCCAKNCHTMMASDKAHLLPQSWRSGWAQDGSWAWAEIMVPVGRLHSFPEALRTSLRASSQLNSRPVVRCRTEVPFLAGSQPRLGFAPGGCPCPFSCFPCGSSTNSRSRPSHTLHLSVQVEKTLFFKGSCH